jgi:hypothetical protein
MAQIFENGPDVMAERFVLLALADYADESGSCYPSIAGLCSKTCMTDRGVQKIIRRLEAGGWLTVTVGGGRRNANYYTLKTPNDVPRNEKKTPNVVRKTPNTVPKTPNDSAENPEHGSPEPSRTIKNHHRTSLSVKSADLLGDVIDPTEIHDPTEQAFDEWYQRYPKKAGKAEAKKAFIKHARKTSPEFLCQKLQEQLPKLKKAHTDGAPEGKSYCPNPATWLNKERYLDRTDTKSKPTLDQIPFEDPFQ